MFKPFLCHFVCVWIGLLCFQPLHKWNSKNYLHLIYKHGGKRFLGNTYIRARSFIFQKEVFPWHTQDIKRLLTSNYCGWFGTDIKYTIYDEKQYRGQTQRHEYNNDDGCWWRSALIVIINIDHHCHVTCGERDIKDTLNSKFNWTERWGDNWWPWQWLQWRWWY